MNISTILIKIILIDLFLVLFDLVILEDLFKDTKVSFDMNFIGDYGNKVNSRY